MSSSAPVGWTSMDDYGRRHCERTAECVTAFARILGLTISEQRTLRLASLLHRVGRFGVPEDITRKPGPLSIDEFEVVKHQLGMAAHLIVDVPHAEKVREVIQYHHERWDGNGYPKGMRGAEIPFLARVLAIGDAFSAITLDRAYRAALSPQAACNELTRVCGTQLDPSLVPAFIEVVGCSSAGARDVVTPPTSRPRTAFTRASI